jgi:hypothetical protein
MGDSILLVLINKSLGKSVLLRGIVCVHLAVGLFLALFYIQLMAFNIIQLMA